MCRTKLGALNQRFKWESTKHIRSGYNNS